MCTSIQTARYQQQLIKQIWCFVFVQLIALITPGLCLVHLSLIFGVPTQQFGIVFLLQAIGGALGAIPNAFKTSHATYEMRLLTTLTFVAVVTLLCPWFNFVTYCTLLFVSTFASSYALTSKQTKLLNLLHIIKQDCNSYHFITI
jgi:fucose permease